MVSGFIDSMHIIYIQADFCQGEDGTLGANLVTMREITRYLKILHIYIYIYM